MGSQRIPPAGAWSFAVWTGIVLASLLWNVSNQRNQALELALNAARANFNKDHAYRLWATDHGGVYVEPDARTPPNPYLAHVPQRDVTTTDGTRLTLVNPAYMLRQMMAEYSDLYGVKGRITGIVALKLVPSSDAHGARRSWQLRGCTRAALPIVRLADLPRPRSVPPDVKTGPRPNHLSL